MTSDVKPAEPSASEKKPGQGRGETILFVDDERSMRVVFDIGLRKNGYRVLVAESGEEALKVWAAHRDTIKLLYTDVFLSTHLDGVELARRLHAEAPTLPIIISSGHHIESVQKCGPMPEGSCFIIKPSDFDSVCKTVRAYLDRAA